MTNYTGKHCDENDCPSPERRGNPFVSAAADTKDWNGLLRQFALSGSGAGLAPEKKYH
jgi:hypothetical protein